MFDIRELFHFFLVIQDWELLVLRVLKWDISAVTPHDFLDQILTRLPLDKNSSKDIKRHAQTFIALCTTGKHSSNIRNLELITLHSS